MIQSSWIGSFSLKYSDSQASGENKSYLLHIDLNILLQAVSVQIQDQVVHEVESVAYDYQRQLVGQLSFFEEVLDTFSVVAV